VKKCIENKFIEKLKNQKKICPAINPRRVSMVPHAQTTTMAVIHAHAIMATLATIVKYVSGNF